MSFFQYTLAVTAFSIIITPLTWGAHRSAYLGGFYRWHPAGMASAIVAAACWALLAAEWLAAK